MLEKPTEGLIESCIEKFNKDPRYAIADKTIENLISKFSENKSLEEIYTKVVVLNGMYSTNIFATFDLAKHILLKDIDSKIKNGDPTTVDDISIGHGIENKKNKKERIFYSFATKYCSWHNQDAYPIFDSFVENILWAYQKQDKYSEFERRVELKDYRKFKHIISDFQSHYGLGKYTLKEIDKFLWMYSKTKLE